MTTPGLSTASVNTSSNFGTHSRSTASPAASSSSAAGRIKRLQQARQANIAIHMEPITHLMTGACLARAGFNRKAAYATVAMTLAAQMPDLDTLWAIDGPIAGFQHHRGWTHTFFGLPIEAAVMVGAVWLWHRWRAGRRPAGDAGSSTARKEAPVRW